MRKMTEAQALLEALQRYMLCLELGTLALSEQCRPPVPESLANSEE